MNKRATAGRRVHLQLSPRIRIIPTRSDRFYWISEWGQGIWKAPFAGEIARLLVSESGSDEILKKIPKAARNQARDTLQALIADGFVSVPSSNARASGQPENPPQISKRRTINRSVTPIVFDEELGRPLGEALLAHDLKLLERSKFWVVAVKDYLDPRLESIHKQCLGRRIAWMLLKPVGEEIWTGPIFRTTSTACWRCLSMRLAEHRWVEAQLFDGKRWPGVPSLTGSESEIRIAGHLAAREAARWLSGDRSLESAVWSLRWESMESRRHVVARFPNCPDCGRPSSSGPRIPRLRKRLILWNPAEELRAAKTVTTLDRLRPIASPITGLVRNMTRMEVDSSYIQGYVAEHNVTLPPQDCRLGGAIRLPGSCSGRGWTPEEAEAGCLAEAVERYALQFRGDEARIRASYPALGPEAIHPANVLLFSDRQYKQRDAWNREHDLNEAVPERFDDSEELEWVPGWSITARRRRYLPAALCSLYYRPPANRWIADADSTGCASGNEFEEAILNGLFELVERDALAIWWYNRVNRSAYKPDLIADIHTQFAHRALCDAGWTVWVLDLTTDLAIPVFAAIGLHGKLGWSLGSGAHHFPLVALRRALSELWQLSTAQIRKGPPPPFKRSKETFGLDIPRQPLRVDLKVLIGQASRKIASAGLEVIVFDLTRKEIEFPVVRVVIPGSRHIKPRFAPGRLYEVPIRLGWLETQRREHEFPVTRP